MELENTYIERFNFFKIFLPNLPNALPWREPVKAILPYITMERAF
jgi:hypothetical protein